MPVSQPVSEGSRSPPRKILGVVVLCTMDTLRQIAWATSLQRWRCVLHLRLSWSAYSSFSSFTELQRFIVYTFPACAVHAAPATVEEHMPAACCSHSTSPPCGHNYHASTCRGVRVCSSCCLCSICDRRGVRILQHYSLLACPRIHLP